MGFTAILLQQPEAFAPTDRRLGNGFRTVKNISPLAQAASQPIHREIRDFTKFKPASDEVYRAYKATIYDYDKTPLNAKDYGVVRETNDWREEKVVIDAAYNGERFAVYLFCPGAHDLLIKRCCFFQARVYGMAADSSTLGYTQFFDYIVQSGHAVVYPVYQSLYERHKDYALNETAMIAAWYKDAGRTLDYLETRRDIDSSRLTFLGVSMARRMVQLSLRCCRIA